jgi:hypothetical protein
VNRHICKKCLIRETAEKEAYETMYSYLAHLSEEIKVPDEVYEARLAVCKECEWLLSGMCRLCGCYVEMRGAVRTRACPDLPPKWTAYQELEPTENP